MFKDCMQAALSMPASGPYDRPSTHPDPADAVYRAAVAEFDRLWETGSGATARDRMEQLLA